MKTMKVCKFIDWVKSKKDRVLYLSVTYWGESLIWKPQCGVIIFDKDVQVGELHPDWTLEKALEFIEGGKAHLVLSDEGEIVLRLRP